MTVNSPRFITSFGMSDYDPKLPLLGCQTQADPAPAFSGEVPTLECAACRTLRANYCLQYDAVFSGPLGKCPMDVRVILKDSLSAFVGK